MTYLFPMAFSLNALTMTALMVVLGVSGHPQLAAEVGIVHGAVTALFFSFSANSRSVILSRSPNLTTDSVFSFRVVLILPLAAVAYVLSTSPMEATIPLAAALILRRCMEWMAELHLSEMELSDNRPFAWRFVVVQAGSFALAVLWLLGDLPLPFLGLFLWAFSPVFLSGRSIVEKLGRGLSLDDSWRLMLPQIGSTMIIGVSLYVFRAMILLLTGKDVAGTLFAAFAIGGIVGSVFAQVLGPTVVLHEQRSRTSFFSFPVKMFLLLIAVAGIVLFFLSQQVPGVLSALGQSALFWGAVSVSMIGGVIMVCAQHIRFGIIQSRGDNNVFGADVLMNLGMVLAVPAVFYVLGEGSFIYLYGINAVLALLFYLSAAREKVFSDDGVDERSWFRSGGGLLWVAIACLILLPLFFQAGSGIFNEPRLGDYDSRGVLTMLPLPLSIAVCFAGILLLGGFRRLNVSLGYVFFTFLFMLIAVFLSVGHDGGLIRGKLLLVVQFLIPAAGLVLGQRYGARRDAIVMMGLGFVIVLATVVPLQLLSTWMHTSLSRPRLYSSVFAFSIYQHVQYVPTIFVSAYLVVLFGLWRRFDLKGRLFLTMLVPVMGVYSAYSHSFSAFLLYLGGTLGFFLWLFLFQKKRKILPFVAVAVLLIFTLGFLWEITAYSRRGSLADMNVHKITTRTDYWEYHFRESLGGYGQFFFGVAHRPDRAEMESAHNYYLDLLYHFGFISLLPLFVLIWLTIRGLYRHRRRLMLSPGFFGLVLVVLFNLFVENFAKVGLRQPYPGIFTFFLWGVLLAQMKQDETKPEVGRDNSRETADVG